MIKDKLLDPDLKNGLKDNFFSSNKKEVTETKEQPTTNVSYEPSSPTTPPGEFKQKLSEIINRGDIGGNAIPIDGLQFRGGSPVISSNSRHVVNELAEVLKDNAELRIKLESAESNRANSVKKGLMDAGINRDRIVTATGNGSGVQMYVY